MPTKTCRVIKRWASGTELFALCEDKHPRGSVWLEVSQDGGRSWQQVTLKHINADHRALVGLAIQDAPDAERATFMDRGWVEP